MSEHILNFPSSTALQPYVRATELVAGQRARKGSQAGRLPGHSNKADTKVRTQQEAFKPYDGKHQRGGNDCEHNFGVTITAHIQHLGYQP